MQEKSGPMLHKHLIWACDLIVLNACCLTVLQAWLVGMDWIWGLSLLNCIFMIALRLWLMRSLRISWMTSPLNRGLKRAADIMLAMLFMTTAFPIIILILAVIIKSNKRHKGPLFSANEICVGEARRFTALTFSNCPPCKGLSIGMTPLVMYLLKGTISLSDISSLSITHAIADMPEGFSEPRQDKPSDDIADKHAED